MLPTEKQVQAGLQYRQAMTPATSAEAALDWLRYKSFPNGQRLGPYLGDYDAFRNYNGSPQREDYTAQVLNDYYAMMLNGGN